MMARRTVRSNAIPPPPSPTDRHNYGAWLRITFAPGTPVRIQIPWDASIAGARGETLGVLWTQIDGYSIDVRVVDARDESGLRVPGLVGRVLSVKPQFLEPLTDNWAQPAYVPQSYRAPRPNSSDPRSLYCTACGGAAHPATGSIEGDKIICGPCVRRFWDWASEHGKKTYRVGPRGKGAKYLAFPTGITKKNRRRTSRLSRNDDIPDVKTELDEAERALARAGDRVRRGLAATADLDGASYHLERLIYVGRELTDAERSRARNLADLLWERRGRGPFQSRRPIRNRRTSGRRTSRRR